MMVVRPDPRVTEQGPEGVIGGVDYQNRNETERVHTRDLFTFLLDELFVQFGMDSDKGQFRGTVPC